MQERGASPRTPRAETSRTAQDVAALRAGAGEIARLLKILSHRNRLLVACELMCGEASVSEIEARTGVRQPVLSRELARLRAAGLVATRRASKLVFYRLADDRLPNIIEGLCVSCAMGRAAAKAGNSSRRTARPRRKAARNLNGGTR